MKQISKVFERTALWCGLVMVTLGVLPKVHARSEDWKVVSTPSVTIVAQGNEKRIKAWARDMDYYVQAFQMLYPVPPERLEKLEMIIFEDGMDTEIRKEFLSGRGSSLRSGIMYHILDDRAFVAVGDLVKDDWGRLQIYREITRWYLAGLDRPQPKWLQDGLVEVIGSLKVDRGRATLDRTVTSGNGFPMRKYAVPLGKFLNSPKGIPYTDAPNQMLPLYEESWALVLYLMCHDGVPGLRKLDQYWARTHAGEPADRVFGEIFQTTPEALEKQLLSFSSDMASSVFTFPHRVVDRSAEFQVKPATADDLDFALGYYWLCIGNPAKAQQGFLRMQSRTPTDPRGEEGLAAVAGASGNSGDVVAHYVKAAELGSNRFLARYYTLVDSAKSFYGGEIAADGSDGTEAREVLDKVKAMERSRPSFREGYQFAAGLMGAVAAVNADDELFLQQAHDWFPDDAIIEAGTAAYEIKVGRLLPAKRRIDRVRAGRLADGDQEVARQYVHKLDLRLSGIVNLQWAQKYYDEGKIAEARQLAAQLARQPLLRDEHLKYDDLQRALAVEDLFASVRQAIVRKEFDAARKSLGKLSEMKLTAKAAETFDKLKAELEASAK